MYIADSGHAPYGERDPAHVIERSRLITAYLRAQHDIKALVIACNTATAAAVATLRQAHPDLPIIGVEPALKPAVSASRTRRIGVMATRGTLGSGKFRGLLESLAGPATFICQACDGLADAIEREDTSRTMSLCADYTQAMGPFGIEEGQIDTLVLGCTHYPFASEHLRQLVGPHVQIIDNGEPIARQTHRLMKSPSGHDTPGKCLLFTTGERTLLQNAARHWLAFDGAVESLVV